MNTETAIRHFGSVQKLAEALRIHRSAVYQWGDQVPPRRALELEKLTRGRLKAPPLEQRVA